MSADQTKYTCQVGHPYNGETKETNLNVLQIRVDTVKGIDEKKFIPELIELLNKHVYDID